LRNGVVVEQHHIVALTAADAVIAGMDETAVAVAHLIA